MRRLTILTVLALACSLFSLAAMHAAAPPASPANLALVASATTSYVSGHETINGLNSGFDPRNSNDKQHGAYGNWPQKGTQWVEYHWSQPIHTGRVDVYWFDDHNGVRLPKACRLLYLDGDKLVPVKNAKGLGLKENQYNSTTFDPVRTTRLRLEMDSSDESTGILQWRVIDLGDSPAFPPVITAGPDRVVVSSGKTWLSGAVRDPLRPNGNGDSISTKVTWSKASGPGDVVFDNANSAETAASFSAVGKYVLKFTAGEDNLQSADTLAVEVVAPPPAEPLKPVEMSRYTVTSPRLKQVIVHWIPHCYEKLSDPRVAEGGIENFVQAANKLAGKPAQRHRGRPWANAYVHNTVESMCWALMYDPQGDAEIIAAQDAMRKKLDDWIPKILAAQQPNGYLQTMYTLNGLRPWTNKGDHEGYTGGYFIEAAIAHYLATDKKDDRLFRAARKLADCWSNNIGPAPKRSWYDGHEEMEQALVRLANFIDAEEGAGKGDKYLKLAQFLLSCRRNGEWYDQSRLPVVRQYEAAGHSVRAAYLYSGMAGVAMRTGDVDYQSALLSIMGNIIDKRYYVTGGIGTGETSEGFGANYSLPNSAYCESCANCGLLFFEHKMNAIHHDARYADLYEDTYYNAVLGDVDLEGKNFTYTNELESNQKRYAWHDCPCCVGNFPRTLLMLPTWMYSTDKDGIYVNMYAGSKVTVGSVAGTKVEIEQKTDYPWKGQVTIFVRPGKEAKFSIYLRNPTRDESPLYTSSPAQKGIMSNLIISVSVKSATVRDFGEIFEKDGYVVLSRKWMAGDEFEFTLPLAPQRIKADERVAADRGRVALRYGPLLYCIESADQNVDSVLAPDAPLTTEWRPDLLDGVVAIRGKFTDGKPMTAVPYYARANRGNGRFTVWIKDK